MAIERIQFRRGTTAEWNDADPILSFGEPGVEVKTDTTLSLKIGDGSTTWSLLPYFGELGSEYVTSAELLVALASYSTTTQMNSAINTAVATGIANVIDSAPATLDTLNEIAAALGDDPDFLTSVLNGLDGKADVSHTHTKSQITDFSHTHTESEITDLGSYIELADISITTASASGNGSLSYDNTSGVFTFTPAQAVPSVTTIAEDTYSMLGSDAGNVVVVESSNAVTFTVEDVFDIGESVAVYKRGTGDITFTAGSNVTIEGAGSSGVDLKLSASYSAIAVMCLASGEYALIGDVDVA